MGSRAFRWSTARATLSGSLPGATSFAISHGTRERMRVHRPVWAEVDLDAVQANVRAFAAEVAPATVCAVVKADGYGHGAVPVARAAISAGASSLAVALVEEGVNVREAGIEAP